MNNVEDIYPLAPMQELMLLHSLRRGGSDLLLDQACYTLRGHLDVAAFHNSWQRIVDRHPALRTAFLWDDLKQPLQVVRREVELPLQEFDFRGLSRDEQASRLEDYLRSDRRRGFQLFQAPLMRLALFRLTSDKTHFICSSHHLILDRWCIAIIHDELSKLYDARARGEPEDLDRPTPYRDYVAWVQRQDLIAAKDFWRKSLAGFVTATPLTTGMNADIENGDAQSMQFSKSTTSALREFARQNSLTLGSLFRAAWAMVLSEMTGRYDIVFGITVVGRPPDLAGVESIVGSFISNLPVRVRLDPAKSLIDVLREMQAYQQRMRRFEFVSLAKVHE
ncbi:MAG: condensation domain-containing protein, partial [Bacteroidetes bacterium]|nr:condensation domain-containing protein [Bacteroidota bacterium]